MNTTPSGNIKIFSCNSNKGLALSVASELGIAIGKSDVGRFADGEISMFVDETVRGSDVYIIQSIAPPVNDNLMELLIMLDAMKRASAVNITAVIPYFGYARQDRKVRSRDPISAKLVSDLLVAAGATRVVTIDLHCAQIQGFFNIPVDHLKGLPIFVEHYLKEFKGRDDITIVSPDLGSVARARSFAEKMRAPLAIVDKRRASANVSEVLNIIGDVEGRVTILVDDMIDTAGTITNAAFELKSRGATVVHACCSHGLLSDPAIDRLEDSPIETLMTLDTIVANKTKDSLNIKTISVASLLANAIYRIHEGLSVSSLFD
jgi:ribose-phosphate pyrophosphokinase